MDPEILETIREAAMALYKQYLSEEARDRVELDQSLLKAVLQRIHGEEPSESWYDDVQAKVMSRSSCVSFASPLAQFPFKFLLQSCSFLKSWTRMSVFIRDFDGIRYSSGCWLILL